MQTNNPANNVKLIVMEGSDLKTYALEMRKEWSFGRFDPTRPQAAPDISVSSKIVSRAHGWFRATDNGWTFVDSARNANGSFHNGQKIPRGFSGENQVVPLRTGDVIRVDNADMNNSAGLAVLLFFASDEGLGQWTSFRLSGKQSVCIGRDPASDIAIDFAGVSAKHCSITCSANRYYLNDFAGTAGTYLNGIRVTQSVVLREKDCISICGCDFYFLGDRLLYLPRYTPEFQAELRRTIPERSPIVLRSRLHCKHLQRLTPEGRAEMICDANFDLREGTMTAIIGKTGADTGALMNCLCGLDNTDVQGSVQYREVDLLRSRELVSSLIGIIGGENQIHSTFTPQLELMHAAMQKLPADASYDEIRSMVTDVLDLLEIQNPDEKKNHQLSSLEQMLVDIGMELVADREILFVSAPSNELDPSAAACVYRMLQNLSRQYGKTVICEANNGTDLDWFDRAVVLEKENGVNRIAFDGLAYDAHRYI